MQILRWVQVRPSIFMLFTSLSPALYEFWIASRLYHYIEQISNEYKYFRDIVDAAHLKPISKHDKMNAQTIACRWNASSSSATWSYDFSIFSLHLQTHAVSTDVIMCLRRNCNLNFELLVIHYSTQKLETRNLQWKHKILKFNCKLRFRFFLDPPLAFRPL